MAQPVKLRFHSAFDDGMVGLLVALVWWPTNAKHLATGN
jgi:hypothetical protein